MSSEPHIKSYRDLRVWQNANGSSVELPMQQSEALGKMLRSLIRTLQQKVKKN
jgi:hypothetical protein